MTVNERPLLSNLACVNPACKSYGKCGLDNLTVRKIYGQDQIRYLRCRHCGKEFSERKNTALWNTKIPESRAIEVGRQLAEGISLKGVLQA
jgi:transposase-like protein